VGDDGVSIQQSGPRDLKKDMEYKENFMSVPGCKIGQYPPS